MIRTAAKETLPKCNINSMTEEEKLAIATAGMDSRREDFKKKLSEILETAKNFGLLYPSTKITIKECSELCDDDLRSVTELVLTDIEKAELKNLMIPIRKGFKELTKTVRQALKEDLILKRLDSLNVNHKETDKGQSPLDTCVQLEKTSYENKEKEENHEEHYDKFNKELQSLFRDDPEVVGKVQKVKDLFKNFLPGFAIVANK